jgi:hypothetical protein
MQGNTWKDILTRIPKNLHNILMLVTSVGVEIAVQSFVRMEEEYLVIRGRLAGTNEAGRVFFVPYEEINHLGFYKELKESQIRAIYGEPEPIEEEAQPLPFAEAPNGTAAGNGEAAKTDAAAESSTKPGAGSADKRTLIERLRARRLQANKQEPKTDA